MTLNVRNTEIKTQGLFEISFQFWILSSDYGLLYHERPIQCCSLSERRISGVRLGRR